MSAPIAPPSVRNNNSDFFDARLSSSPQGHGIDNKHPWLNNPWLKTKGKEGIGGQYGSLGAHGALNVNHGENDEDSFSADAPIAKMVDQQIDGLVPRSVLSKKGDHKEMYMIPEEGEEGEKGEKQIAPHSHHDLSKHLAAQSASIGDHHFGRHA